MEMSTMKQTITDHGVEEIRDYILDTIGDYVGMEYAEDLHHEMFNTDYYIVGIYQAKKWCEDSVFDIIETIKEYENDNFGEVNTDFSSPEHVVNMYVYIVGERLLSECFNLLEGELTSERIEEIKLCLGS
jgi:hypothetical protein